jgi:hypothetical protein
MTTSEVTIACAVLVGRKPSAFSDRASRWCIFAAERATPAGVPRSRAGEQPEAVAQPRCDLLRGERAHPGGGQLERQRHAVQPLADPQHRGPRSNHPRRTIPFSTQGGQKLNTWAGVAEGRLAIKITWPSL